MQKDPASDLRYLREIYQQMLDGELLALAADSESLTAPARQVLEEEMRNRALTLPAPTSGEAETRSVLAHVEPPVSSVFGMGFPPVVLSDEGADEVQPHDYSWKVILCECEERIQALQLQEALRRAGIESWVEDACVPGDLCLTGIRYPRVLVAADELEKARAIAASPIPREIADELRKEMEEPETYTMPSCPVCHAPDPVLEGAEPSNQWFCVICGHRWSEGWEINQ